MWSANYTFNSNILRVTGRMGTNADFAVKHFSSKHFFKHLKVLETVFST